nr:MAG TPA: helix-turn-helix domain protein [Caudoviricetes sp.]
MSLQYINDRQGRPQYVVLPVADYRRLIADADDETVWEPIPYESDQYDDETVPSEVVDIMLDKDVSIVAAWRIYRGMNQNEAAKQLGISQSALSQIEKKGNRPQEKTLEQLAALYDCEIAQLAV